eukprot:TRINITY_DN2370_c0_g2_i1.p1 TRINITY_DN2370_c0_g2~~TRINITY_DN2370_c0_g2_i1.p1  ORF type:complete len:546 (+),score=172.90 TRINITY_DN2370_c0_g2_i1:38-1675(+)
MAKEEATDGMTDPSHKPEYDQHEPSVQVDEQAEQEHQPSHKVCDVDGDQPASAHERGEHVKDDVVAVNGGGDDGEESVIAENGRGEASVGVKEQDEQESVKVGDVIEHDGGEQDGEDLSVKVSNVVTQEQLEEVSVKVRDDDGGREQEEEDEVSVKVSDGKPGEEEEEEEDVMMRDAKDGHEKVTVVTNVVVDDGGEEAGDDERMESIECRENLSKDPPSRGEGEDDEEDTAEYEVEALLDRKYDRKLRQFMYLVQWKGFDHEQNSWEPAENLENSAVLMAEVDQKIEESRKEAKKLTKKRKPEQTPPSERVLRARFQEPQINEQQNSHGRVLRPRRKSNDGDQQEDRVEPKKLSFDNAEDQDESISPPRLVEVEDAEDQGNNGHVVMEEVSAESPQSIEVEEDVDVSRKNNHQVSDENDEKVLERKQLRSQSKNSSSSSSAKKTRRSATRKYDNAVSSKKRKASRVSQSSRSKKSRLIEQEEPEQYVVEAITNHKKHPTEDGFLYYIKWLGYPKSQNSWEPYDHLTSCASMVEQYHKLNGLPTI